MRDLNACLHRRSQIGLSSSHLILGRDKNVILAFLYFLVSPRDPITRAPTLNTGHSHSICLFPDPLSQQIQEQVRECPSLGLGLENSWLFCLSWVQHFRLTSFRPLPPVFCYIYAHLPQVLLIQKAPDGLGWLCPSNVFWMSVLSREKVSTQPISFQGGDARSP